MKTSAKSALCIVLAAAMLFCFTACGKDTSGLGTLDIGDSSGGGDLAPLGGSDSNDSGNETAPAPEPSEEPQPDTDSGSETEEGNGNEFLVEEYSCSDFNCYIPQGWNVDYNVIDAGGGIVRIYIFVQDPSDSNNIIFYISGLEPYVTSLSDKNALVAFGGSTYEWVPVLEKLSAEGVLEQWGTCYTMMNVTGFDAGVKYFKNYGISSVLYSQVADGSNADLTTSQVLAEVTIPGASGTYGFLLAGSLSRKYISDAGITYYVSYDNMGFALSAEHYNSESDGIIYCLNSLDLSGFKQKYSSSVGFTADEIEPPVPVISLPKVAVG